MSEQNQDHELPITEEISEPGPTSSPANVALRARIEEERRVQARMEIAADPSELRKLLEEVLTEERTDIAISYLTGWLRVPLLGTALDLLLPERLIDAVVWAVERRGPQGTR